MSILLFLIPVSIVIALVFLGAFIWAVRSGQYEDTTTPSMRLLSEEAAGMPSGTERRGSPMPGAGERNEQGGVEREGNGE